MKYKKIPLFFLLGVFCFSLLHSQSTNRNDIFDNSKSRIIAFDNSDKSTVGSPYLFKEYTPAKITLIKEICLVNFDAYNDKMYVEKNGKFYNLPLNDFKYGILFINKKISYQLFNYKRKKEMTSGFFQVLTKNNGIYLLKKEHIRKLEAKKANNGYEKSQPVTFKRTKDHFYTSFENNMAIKLAPKKKHFLSLFNLQGTVIASYMKQQKLSHKKEADLIKIFKYYASLN